MPITTVTGVVYLRISWEMEETAKDKSTGTMLAQCFGCDNF